MEKGKQPEKAAYYDFNYVTFWKMQSYGDKEKIS
jgi:hypothetical protein